MNYNRVSDAIPPSENPSRASLKLPCLLSGHLTKRSSLNLSFRPIRAIRSTVRPDRFVETIETYALALSGRCFTVEVTFLQFGRRKKSR